MEPARQSPAEGRIRVLLVDDHVMFSAGLAAVLEADGDIEVTGTAVDLAAARAALVDDPVDVVLLDERLPDGRGVLGLPALKRLSPTTRFLVLTGVADDGTLLAAIEAGAAGFLEKTSPVPELLAAVRAVSAGEAITSAELLTRLFGRLHASPAPPGRDLTARELEILGLLAEGLSNAAIASRTYVTVNTVRNHVANILAKLGVHSKLEALALAVKEGLVDLGR